MRGIHKPARQLCAAAQAPPSPLAAPGTAAVPPAPAAGGGCGVMAELVVENADTPAKPSDYIFINHLQLVR